MAKILNLDSVSPKATRELVLGGKSYVIKDMTVEDFIATQKAGEKLESENATLAQAMEVTIDLIMTSIPTMQREVLIKCPMEQLRAIAEFVRGADPAEILKALAEQAAEMAGELPASAEEGEAGKP